MDSESEEDFIIADSFANAYQDEPLAPPGEEESDEDADEDGLLPATLEARYDGTTSLNEWYVV